MRTSFVIAASVVGTLVVAGLGVALVGKVQNSAGMGNDSAVTSVRVERATRGELIEIVSVPGDVQPEPQLRVPISARVSARIIELPFKEWDKVTKGNPKTNPPVPPSVLVRLDAKDLEATMRSVKARYAAQEAQVVVTKAKFESQRSQITANEASLRDAQRDLKRQQDLFTSRDVSQSTVDTAQTKVDELLARLDASRHDLAAAEQELVVLQHQLTAAEAEIARAQEDLNNSVILSPIDGVVTRLRMKVGELAIVGVENNALTNIMEVADLSQMVMLARVDEANVASLKIGQRAIVRMPAYRDETFEGTVESISPSLVDPGMGANSLSFFEARIKLKISGRQIYTGLTADADIETNHHEGIRIQSQAILGRPLDSLPDDIRKSAAVRTDKSVASVVFRVVDGKAVATPVTVGASDETRTLIKSGLNEGDEVIVGPYKVLDALKHDQKVKVEETPSTSPTTAPTTKAS